MALPSLRPTVFAVGAPLPVFPSLLRTNIARDGFSLLRPPLPTAAGTSSLFAPHRHSVFYHFLHRIDPFLALRFNPRCPSEVSPLHFALGTRIPNCTQRLSPAYPSLTFFAAFPTNRRRVESHDVRVGD